MHLGKMRGMPRRRLQPPQHLSNEAKSEIKFKNTVRRHRNNQNVSSPGLKIFKVDRRSLLPVTFPLLLLLAGLNGLTQVDALKGKCQQMPRHLQVKVAVALPYTIPFEGQYDKQFPPKKPKQILCGCIWLSAYRSSIFLRDALPIYLLASFVSIYVFFPSPSFWLFLVATHQQQQQRQQHCEIKALRFIYACNVR